MAEPLQSPNPISHPTPPPPRMRKTRFVCISDTHNATAPSSFQLPLGDVLIHAGDLTNQGSYSELRKTIKWIEDADFEAKIIVAGNHDITLDSEFSTQQQHTSSSNHPPQSPHQQSLSLLTSSPSILYLHHSSAEVNLSSPTGPHTTFRIFGSPLSPTPSSGPSPWAFTYPTPSPLTSHIWSAIPLDADIVVTHTPPKYHLDSRSDRRSVGCEDLRQALWRVRPRLAVCGHVHESRGAEIVRWDLEGRNVKYREESVRRWEDPGRGNKKMSYVDLTTRSGFENDGAVGERVDLEGGLVMSDGLAEHLQPLLSGVQDPRSRSKSGANIDANTNAKSRHRSRSRSRSRSRKPRPSIPQTLTTLSLPLLAIPPLPSHPQPTVTAASPPPPVATSKPSPAVSPERKLASSTLQLWDAAGRIVVAVILQQGQGQGQGQQQGRAQQGERERLVVIAVQQQHQEEEKYSTNL
ncbi:hypothetical protein ACMFMF_008081 [Clarireedia jacksonii]